MALNISQAKDALRAALSALTPTGADAFEGLMAAVLSAATGHAFRLAAGHPADAVGDLMPWTPVG